MVHIKFGEGRLRISSPKGFDFAVDSSGNLVISADSIAVQVGNVTLTSGPGGAPSLKQGMAGASLPVLHGQSTGTMKPPAAAKARGLMEPGHSSYDYLRMLLERAEQPLSLDELERMLRTETAFETVSVHLRNTIRTAMARKPEIFRKVSRTHWGLQEWQEEEPDERTS